MTYAEKCLYEYPANLAKIEMLSEELKLLKASGDVQGMSYEIRNNSYGVSDPVSTHFQKVESIEGKIYRLTRSTEPIKKMYEVLCSPYVLEGSKSADYRKILELFYWGRNSVQNILNYLSWSKTSFYVRRQGLLRMTEEYLNV